jgi:hypothetical protein
MLGVLGVLGVIRVLGARPVLSVLRVLRVRRVLRVLGVMRVLSMRGVLSALRVLGARPVVSVLRVLSVRPVVSVLRVLSVRPVLRVIGVKRVPTTRGVLSLLRVRPMLGVRSVLGVRRVLQVSLLPWMSMLGVAGVGGVLAALRASAVRPGASRAPRGRVEEVGLRLVPLVCRAVVIVDPLLRPLTMTRPTDGIPLLLSGGRMIRVLLGLRFLPPFIPALMANLELGPLAQPLSLEVMLEVAVDLSGSMASDHVVVKASVDRGLDTVLRGGKEVRAVRTLAFPSRAGRIVRTGSWKRNWRNHLDPSKAGRAGKHPSPSDAYQPSRKYRVGHALRPDRNVETINNILFKS